MRLALLTTLALLPTAAFAQAGSQTTLQARLSQPAAFAGAAAPATSSAPAVALAAPHLHDVLKTELSSPTMDATLAQGGSLVYTLAGSNADSSKLVAPVLVHTVGRALPVSAAENTDAKVVLELAVDVDGKPSDIRVLRSGGAAVDKGTIAAVSQYRFKPATYDNTPAVAHLTMEIALQK